MRMIIKYWDFRNAKIEFFCTLFIFVWMTVVVPNIVHQIYDYQSPNLFLYLSLKCVQQFLRPDKHYLIINNEGKYRR